MASPQKENGFTPIANEIMEAMAKHNFGFSKGQVFMAIIRLTYGWHKRSDKISISRICDITKLSKRTVIYTLQNLEAQNKIIINRSYRNHEKQINEISIQKDYHKWNDNSFALPYLRLKEKAKERSAKQYSSAKENISSAKQCEKVVQNNVKDMNSFAHTKETITKDITKERDFKNSSNLKNKKINIYGNTDPGAVGWVDPKKYGLGI